LRQRAYQYWPGEVPLAAVHDRVPEAAGLRVQTLRDHVRLVEPVVVEPEPGKQGACVFAAADLAADDPVGGGAVEQALGLGVALAGADDELRVGVAGVEAQEVLRKGGEVVGVILCDVL
jgi:hypothetical protein